MLYIVLYLVSIVLANLSVAAFGPSVAIINAFLFIGLDLTARDKLHEAWKESRLVLKMFLLVLAGSVLSWLLNKNAGTVAVASFTAFALAGIVDSVSYHLLRNKEYLVKVNGSNIFSALTDSIVFPTLAFGQWLPLIVLGQFAAKVGGGFVWSLVLNMVNGDKV